MIVTDLGGWRLRAAGIDLGLGRSSSFPTVARDADGRSKGYSINVHVPDAKLPRAWRSSTT